MDAPLNPEQTEAAKHVIEAQRIMVIGCPGSGKSYLSREMARSSTLPLYSLDDIYWGMDWRRPSNQEFENNLQEIIHYQSGIIDGNYARFQSIIKPWAQAVIFLDLPAHQSIFGVISRSLRRGLGDTSDLPRLVKQGRSQREPMSRKFIWLILSFRYRERPKILLRFRDFDPKRFIVLKSRREVKAFLKLFVSSTSASLATNQVGDNNDFNH